jgi:type IV pilus assembly protein PilV
VLRRAIRNRKGFTLIELLVSILVLSIGLMAMLDGLANYVRINIDNQMRNEAMRIAETALETLRNARFSDVQTGAVVITTPEQRRFRNIPVNFAVSWTRTNISSNTVAVQVSVTWSHRSVNHRHDAASIISTDA